jgi:transcription elongation factor Elf1
MIKGKCPKCGQGILSIHSEYLEAEHNGVKENILSFYAVCSHCENRVVSSALKAVNKYMSTDFINRVNNPQSVATS